MLITVWLLISLVGQPSYTINAYETKAECIKARDAGDAVEKRMCVEFSYLTASSANVTKDYKRFS